MELEGGLPGYFFGSCAPSRNAIANPLFLFIVFKKPLALFSQQPMTGFYRDGYCRVGPEDGGNHAVAGTHIPPRPYPLYPSFL